MKVCEDYVINSMGFQGVTYVLIKWSHEFSNGITRCRLTNNDTTQECIY